MASAKQEPAHRGPWQKGQCRFPQIKSGLFQVWFLQDGSRTQRAEPSVTDIFLQRFCFSRISLANDKVTGQIHHPLVFKPCHDTKSTQGFTVTNAINIPVLDFNSLPQFLYYFLSQLQLNRAEPPLCLCPIPQGFTHTPGISSVPTVFSSSSALRDGISGMETEFQLFQMCLVLIWE